MSLKYFAVTVLCFVTLLCIKVEVLANVEKDLWRHLFEFQEYDKNFRPVKNPKTAVPVSLGVAPISLIRPLEENLYYYEVESWLVVKWKDEYLTWNPKDFQNLDQLILPISKVWSPDFSLYLGNFENSTLSNFTSNNVAVRFDGELTWIKPNRLRRYCDFTSIQYTCVISFLSWKYDISLMDIDFNTNMNETLNSFTVKGSKELKYFIWSDKPHPLINFTLTLPY